MKVIRAEKAGFCSGVKKAVDTLINEAEKQGGGSTLGPIVHNDEVIKFLKSKQVITVDKPENACGSFLAIRTHGIPPEEIKLLNDLDKFEIIDLTCPRVKRVQKIAADLNKQKYNIYIFGDRNHPEVIGIAGWSGNNTTIFSSIDELLNLDIKEPAALIAQTTANPDAYLQAIEIFLGKSSEALVYKTLCPETGLRQEEVINLAERVEALVVVGSKSSANTTALYDCCRQLKPTCLVNNFWELDRSFLDQYSVIGVTAGASTPPWTIKEVVDRMENENMEMKNEEVKKEETQVEAQSEESMKEESEHEVVQNEEDKVEEVEEVIQNEEVAVEEVKEEVVEVKSELEEVENEEVAAEVIEDTVVEEESFEFNEDVKVAQVGEQVTGKVARVTDDEVFVDIGAKTEAILPVAEVHLPAGKKLAELFTPEDDLEVTVLDIDEQDGKVVVSHKRLAREKRLKELEQAQEDGLILEAPVKQIVGAGIVINLGDGIEGFMPGSLVDVKYIPDFNEFKDQQLKFKILEFDREKGKLILSRKIILEEESAKAKEETLKSIEVGSNITGTVKRLTDFGAFVDVGGIDGLVHISELSWERVSHPGEVLKVGDEIEVKVLEVIPEKDRISLSIRKTQPDPWTKAAEDLESGQLMTGKVTRLVNFGAFIELKPGVEGLAHISQLADYHVKHPSEVLTEGEEVEVKIIEVKTKSKRISLSIKEAGGVMVSQNVSTGNGTENGNVTLGDVFGDLFETEDYQTNAETETVEEPIADDIENEEKVEGGQE
ncbi:MAG: bifunctional 4-hydroxy-3-methylbut-2-enyl diphosphate reductase/30S ribosomal protein S1 [Bacillota bacterium]|nr:bifunctional 4-hydroxy-3-methylbut-2-enyl diphosphate reductase/30S ribosomal protein S1 [Bacillota bacterium]